MVKAANSFLLKKLASETHRCTYIARLTRVDGKTFGFIEADTDVTIDGVVYRAMGGMQSSTTKQQANASPNHQTFVGFLSSPDMEEREIAAGLFDNAKIDIAIVDLDNIPSTFNPTDMLWLGSFYMGEVKTVDGVFQAEIVSFAQKLKTTPIEITSPTCRATFGDQRCKYNLSTVTINTSVVEIINNQTIRVADDLSSLFLRQGTAKFTSGTLNDQTFDVKDYIGGALVFFIPLDITPSVGDTVSVTAGCDKTIDRCRAYNNAINFQGEPNIPGADKWKAGFKEVL